MNVTMTGRPRSAASETDAPFWSLRRNAGARLTPFGHDVAGPDVMPVALLLGERRTTSAAPAPIPTRAATPQRTQRMRRPGARAGGDEVCDATRRAYPWNLTAVPQACLTACSRPSGTMRA